MKFRDTHLAFSFPFTFIWFLVGYLAGLVLVGLRAGFDAAYNLVTPKEQHNETDNTDTSST